MERDNDSSRAPARIEDEYGIEECAATMEGGYLPYIEQDECSAERRALVAEVAALRAELTGETARADEHMRQRFTAEAERDEDRANVDRILRARVVEWARKDMRAADALLSALGAIHAVYMASEQEATDA